MRKILPVAAFALLFPLAASAQLRLGASIGYASPMGEIAAGGDMKDLITGAVPMEVTGQFDVGPNASVGAYLGYAPGFLHKDWKDLCDAADEICRIYAWGVGAVGEVRLGDAGGIRPFVGARAGFGWLTFREAVGEGTNQLWAKAGFKGWEVGLQGGADVSVSEGASIGAFVGFTYGEYGTAYFKYSDSTSGTNRSFEIPDTAAHQWLTIGVRGTFGR